MINLEVKAFDEMTALIKRMREKMPPTLEKAGVIIRREMRDDLNVSGSGKKDPSAPGTAPHRQKGLLRNSIMFGMNGDNEVVIGSMPRSYGWYGRIHEHGGNLPSSITFTPKKYSIGDTGPIRIGRGDFRRNKKGQITGQSGTIVTKITLETAAQVEQANMLNRLMAKSRSKNIVAQADTTPTKTIAKYPARPFAQPALIRNLDKIPPVFRAIL